MRERGFPPEVLCAEYEAVFRYVMCLCRSREAAEDVTQEAFARAMDCRSSFEGGSSLYTWLCSIAKNIWLTRCRKQQRELPAETEEGDYFSTDSIEEQLDDRDTAMHIHRILHAIDEPYKEVFSLRVFGQLPFAGIAGLFGRTESWARVTYHRARRMIGEQMRKDGFYE